MTAQNGGDIYSVRLEGQCYPHCQTCADSGFRHLGHHKFEARILKHCSCYQFIVAKHAAEVCTGMEHGCRRFYTMRMRAPRMCTRGPCYISISDRQNGHAYANQWEQPMSKPGNAIPAQRSIILNIITCGCAQPMETRVTLEGFLRCPGHS